jgi:hypothetical protein
MTMYEELVKRLRETTVNYDEKCESCPYVEEYPCCVDCLDRMHIRAADAIEKLEKSIPHWIPVTERLPESQGPFLTRYGFGDASIKTGQFYYGVLYYLYADAEPHWQRANEGVEVTHWMRIPKLPKEET